jgi:hypothetical protein
VGDAGRRLARDLEDARPAPRGPHPAARRRGGGEAAVRFLTLSIRNPLRDEELAQGKQAVVDLLAEYKRIGVKSTSCSISGGTISAG